MIGKGCQVGVVAFFWQQRMALMPVRVKARKLLKIAKKVKVMVDILVRVLVE